MLVRLGHPVVEDRGDVVRWSVPLSADAHFPDSLWFEVPSHWTHMLTDRVDPAVVAMLIPALRAGYDLRVEGQVTDELAFTHRELQALYGRCGNGAPRDVEFRSTVPARRGGEDVLAGFSGGVDSFAMLDQFLADDTPKDWRLTHLLFNNVGSHGHGAEELWRRRYRRLVHATDKIGLPFIPVNSNVASLPGTENFEQVNSASNAAVGHLLAGSARRWVFSSSVEFRRISISEKVYNSAFVDSIALPLMSTGGITLKLSRADWRRIDKMRAVAGQEVAWGALDVCTRVEPHGFPNCSVCWKCRMTLGALDLLGAEGRFSSQFDLARWREHREHYLASVRYTTSPALVAELGELMDEVGYEVPVGARVRGRAGAVRGGLLRWRREARRALGGAVRSSRWSKG